MLILSHDEQVHVGGLVKLGAVNPFPAFPPQPFMLLRTPRVFRVPVPLLNCAILVTCIVCTGRAGTA
jgi:hypothetical protein